MAMLAGQSPPHRHFPILGCVLVDDDRQVMHELVAGATRSILPPQRTRAYSLTYAGCEWYFLVTDHPAAREVEIAEAVSLAGEITLLVHHHLQSNSGQSIVAGLRKAQAAGRLKD